MPNHLFISNAFSLNMVSLDCYNLEVLKCSKEMATTMLRQQEFTCAIGHKDTAALVSQDLGIELEMNRISLNFNFGDVLIVAQYKGPRLSEGTIVLPEGACIEYLMCVILPVE